MTFTLENTKDATHIRFYDSMSPQMFIEKREGYSFLNDETSGWADQPNGGGIGNDAIVLSRPHNETREYWTTNDVTQYAQGNKMNTKEMLPISHVKKFTPLVVGDVVMSDNREHVITGGSESLLATWNSEISDKDWRLVSFAGRPNTGIQPVGDDIMVDVSWSDPDDPMKAQNRNWHISETNETWKPNHAAMLKQYQAEQAKADRSKLAQSEIDALSEALLGSPVAPCDGQIPKPVFTQAMADAKELPPIGWVGETSAKAINNPIFSRFEGREVTIIAHKEDVAVFSYEDDEGELEYHGLVSRKFKPIQTDEEKAIDAMFVEMNTNMQLRGDHDDYMVNDDTQVGVEFVIEYMAANGFKWVGE